MITLTNPNETSVHKYVGLSTDTKPTEGVPNGSTFIEMDKDSKYYFDGTNNRWNKVTVG